MSPRAGSTTAVGATLFVDPDSSRSRRPLDVAAVVIGVIGLLLAAHAANAQGPLVTSMSRLADALPSWSRNLFRGSYALGTAYVVVVVLLVLRAPKRRVPVLVTLGMAAAMAFLSAVIASLVVEDRWPDFSRGWTTDTAGGHEFPVVGVAVLTALLLAIRPWMVLAYQRLDLLLVAVLCVASWAVGAGTPAAVIGALALGIGAAGTALLVLGSPGGHPDLAAVGSSLAELGLRTEDLHFAEVQPWGARVLSGTGEDGEPIVVKVYGRDAVDAHRAARWWRAIAYREQTMPGATRLQMVEHEALMTLLADRAGVAVPPVIAATSNRGDALIVLRAPPPSFAELDDDVLDDAALHQIWRTVASMHRARLCHGELTLARIAPEDGDIVVSDFTYGSMAAAPDDLAQETATLLTSQALRVGTARALDAAIDATDGSTLADARAYLQRPALPHELRSGSGLKKVLDGLRDDITDRTGAPPVEPAPILRVQLRYILMSGLLFLAAYALVGALAGLDWSVVFDSWRNASWDWIVLGLVTAQLTNVADSATTMSVVPTRLPLFPLVHLQYAIKFVGLAVSATVGRVGMNTAFLRKFGQGPTVAVAASALDSMAGAVVNVVVVALSLLLGSTLLGGSADEQVTLDTSGIQRLVVAIVALVVLVLVLVALVPSLRARVHTVVDHARTELRTVALSPGRMLGLFGSNLASLLITAVAMSCMIRGIYTSLPFWTVVTVTAGAALFASLIPVPGNVGVAEAAITAGLTLAGIPEAPAFAIAVTQRMATTYLQQCFGAYSLHWLREKEYA